MLSMVRPYPERLHSLLSDKDYNNTRILSQRLQEVPIDIFNSLEKGDILFIDSSHVSKTGSDVNMLLFEILPSLKKGVYIHFHDIFFPFEYPKNWVNEGVAWIEAYILRAFLQYNSAFEIVFFLSYLLEQHKEEVFDFLPLALESETADISLYDDAPGAGLWLKKI